MFFQGGSVTDTPFFSRTPSKVRPTPPRCGRKYLSQFMEISEEGEVADAASEEGEVIDDDNSEVPQISATHSAVSDTPRASAIEVSEGEVSDVERLSSNVDGESKQSPDRPSAAELSEGEVIEDSQGNFSNFCCILYSLTVTSNQLIWLLNLDEGSMEEGEVADENQFEGPSTAVYSGDLDSDLKTSDQRAPQEGDLIGGAQSTARSSTHKVNSERLSRFRKISGFVSKIRFCKQKKYQLYF